MEAFDHLYDTDKVAMEGLVVSSLMTDEKPVSINYDSKRAQNFLKRQTDLEQLPELVIEGSSSSKNYRYSQVEEVRIFGVKGKEAVVHAIEVAAGDTIFDLVKGLHPGLSRQQLEHEINQIEKYNRDFGNPITRHDRFSEDQPIYLTSIKKHDSSGRLNQVVRPDGSVIEVEYGETGSLSSYRIIDRGGAILESARQDESGSWTRNKSGLLHAFDNARIDRNGNIIIEELSGNELVHLSNGVTLLVAKQMGKPSKIESFLNGVRIQAVEFQSLPTGIKIETTYFDSNGFSKVVNRFISRNERLPESLVYDHQPDKRAIELAKIGREIASSMGTTGRCAEGVQLALARAGFPQFLGCGHAWDMLDVLDGSGLFEMVRTDSVQPGDIMFRKSATGYYGHIAIVLGRDKSGSLIEASDHVSATNLDNPSYSKTVFLRLK